MAALPLLAELIELEARLGLDAGTLTGADKARALAALTDASTLVREEARQDFLTDEGVPNPPEVIVRVVLGAALRNYRNPDAEISQTVGPFNRAFKQTETAVYLTEVERDIVRRYRPQSNSTGGLWTMRTTKDGSGEDTLFLEDSFGFELFPVGTKDKPWL